MRVIILCAIALLCACGGNGTGNGTKMDFAKMTTEEQLSFAADVFKKFKDTCPDQNLKDLAYAAQIEWNLGKEEYQSIEGFPGDGIITGVAVRPNGNLLITSFVHISFSYEYYREYQGKNLDVIEVDIEVTPDMNITNKSYCLGFSKGKVIKIGNNDLSIKELLITQ